MSFLSTKLGFLAGGFILGTAGVKILSSNDMKKAYTKCTAAGLRMKDQAVKDFTILSENCSDIVADAQAINEQRAAEKEAQIIEDAKAIVAAAEEKAE